MITMFREMLTVQREANAAVVRQLEQRLEASERMNQQALDRLATVQSGPTVNTQPATTSFKVLDEILSVKEKIDALTGGNENNSGIPGWVPYALQGFKMLGDVVTNVMHNAAVARSGNGQVAPPPQLSAELPDEETQANDTNATYARQFHEPMKDALTRKMSGHEFGARLILQLGNAQAYDFLQSQGKDGLMALLQSAPEVWGTFQRFSVGRQNEIFLDEFLDRDAVMATIQQIQEQSKPKPRATGRTVIGSDGKPIRTAGPVVNTSAEPA
jgi:hypothetical protein